jgi:hypothetical protein
MTQDEAGERLEPQAGEPSPEPVPILAGRLVIYDDTAAGRGYVLMFQHDESGQLVKPQIPGMIVPLLAKVLGGEELTAADLPGGAPVRMLAARMMGAPDNGG